ncbi:MAG: hypothetical protein HY644_01265 [Acidobacteria bacterium]|nr:hypothetical protein [Acidobacteriota bacterium]
MDPEATAGSECPSDAAPPVSVIIASELNDSYVRRCLSSLLPQSRRLQAEVIVTYPAGTPGEETLSREFTEVRFIKIAAANSIPALRYAGVGQASGEILAMTESSAIFQEGWIQGMLQGHARGFNTVGGPIDPDPGFDLRSWAAHICEYGAYTSPVDQGPAKDLSGFNVSYRKALLEKCQGAIRQEHWENVLHEEARKVGARLLLTGRMHIINSRRYKVGEFTLQRFVYGRDYGRVRAGRIPAVAHLTLLVLTAGLPFLMLFRYARWVLRKRLSFCRAVASFPLLALFATAWSVGEWCGYVLAIPRRFNKV